MTRHEIIRTMQQSVGGSSFITASELTRYLGQKNVDRIRKKYCMDLEHVGKAYFIPDVATVLMERRKL